MSAFERKLASLKPDRQGLDVEAMIFAAGLAEGRRGRSAWTATCGALAAVAFGLGVWGVSERGERQTLAARLATPATAPIIVQDRIHDPSPMSAPPANALYSLRKSMEQDPDRWIAMSDVSATPPIAPEPKDEPRILNAVRRNETFAQ